MGSQRGEGRGAFPGVVTSRRCRFSNRNATGSRLKRQPTTEKQQEKEVKREV